jgi:glutamate formiminotransferase/formiminotetrahydrofolate cyclodeaminase
VKAMGVLVDGRAQVSMNLTNYRQSSIARVVEFVRREAQRYGTIIHHTELVGLTPEESLIDAAIWYLQLDQFEPEQILERRLFEVQTLAESQEVISSEPTFLDRLASATATPGGGSASAFTAAEAAALVAMVARLTVGKKKYADVESQMWPIIERADALSKNFQQAELDDSTAFDTLMSAMKLPKDSDEQKEKRTNAVEQATLGAIEVPFHVAELIPEVLTLTIQVAKLGNANAISDAGTAGALAKGAFTGVVLNIRINAAGITNPKVTQHYLQKILDIEKTVATHYAELQKVLADRADIQMPG